MAARHIFTHSSLEGTSSSDYFNYLMQYLKDSAHAIEVCSEYSVYESCLRFQSMARDDIIVVIIDMVRFKHELIPFLRGITSGELTTRTRVILLSSLLTWSGHSSVTSIESIETALKSRVPVHAYAETLQLENSCFALSSSTFEAVVIGKGLIYGRNGFDFSPIMKSFLFDDNIVPIMHPAEASAPAIHIDDLCSIVEHLISADYIPLYVPAVDACPDTLHSIITNIANEFDVSGFKYCELENLLHFAIENSESTNLFHSNLKFSNLPTQNISLKYPQGLSKENLPVIVSEYKTLNNLSPCRLMVVGMPYAGKTTVAKSIAQM